MSNTNRQLSTSEAQKLGDFTKVSDQIRYLYSLNYSFSQIANQLNKRYQHVRNVITEDIRVGKLKPNKK